MKQVLLLAGLAGAVLGSPTVLAVTYDLCVDELSMTMHDGTVVEMWGYGTLDGTVCTASVPGPELNVPAGDTTLTVNLTNNLATSTNPNVTSAVSLVIAGQGLPADSTPVMIDVNGKPRVQSFTDVTLSGDTRTYTFNNLRPGSYLYSSGTHPAVQVQMGLYGAVKNETASGTLYNGISYDEEALIVMSEVDSALHNAVSSGIYGTDDYPSTINYVPDYFLVNGNSLGDTLIPIAAPGQINLLRFMNAGLDNRSMVLQGGHMDLISEDGNLYPFPREQYSLLMAAGKTRDALFVADAEGLYPVYDRRLSSGLRLKLDSSGGAAGPVASDDSDSVSENESLIIAVLSNDNDSGSGATIDVETVEIISAPNYGTAVVQLGGTIEYTPYSNVSGIDSLTYRFSDTNGVQSNVATVTIQINGFAEAVDDAFTVVADGTAHTLDVLANDFDTEGDSYSVTSFVSPVNGVVVNNGSTLSYTPNDNFLGNDPFTYTITGGATANVSVTVVEPTVNQPPTANPDVYSMARNSGATSLNVLANDTDPEGQVLTLASITDGPTNGSASVSGNVIIYTPNGNFSGVDNLTYSISDSEGATATAEVTLNVINPPPVAVDDYGSVTRNNGNSNNSVTIDLLVNDTDDIALLSDSVAIQTQPRKGSVSVDVNGIATYTPLAGKRGSDTFSYTVSDDEGAVSNEAVVRIDITK